MKTNIQKKILKSIKIYLRAVREKGIDTAKSIFCYFACWEETPGFLLINKNKNSFFKIIKTYFKSIYAIGKQSKYETLNLNKKKNFSNIFVTWGYKSSFNEKGEFFDHYSNNLSGKKKNSLWFVIYMDAVLPKKVNDNVVLLFNKEIRFNFLYFIKIIIKNLLKNKFNIFYFLHYSNSFTNFGYICLKKIKTVLKNNDIKRVIMPYEGQIFQKMICKYIDENYKKIITQGFIHDFEPFYPSHCYDTCSPKNLIVTNGREDFFIKYLDWPKKKYFLLHHRDIKREKLIIHLLIRFVFQVTFIMKKKFLIILKNLLN